MMPMLRLFRHGDGTLALFNGMGVTPPDLLATILAYDDVRAQALTSARNSGYQRLEAADAIALIDAGLPPPQIYSKRAHAGCSSFEFSVGAQRLVINCGAPDANRAAAHEAARMTAAHSTLVIDDTRAVSPLTRVAKMARRSDLSPTRSMSSATTCLRNNGDCRA
jgi:uncharacterized heparinase superfamily protein